jgi:hypothetical protein
MRTEKAVVCLAVAAWLGVYGCASEPKQAPPPSQGQIQADSDRFFEKVKQEERERDAGPQAEK